MSNGLEVNVRAQGRRSTTAFCIFIWLHVWHEHQFKYNLLCNIYNDDFDFLAVLRVMFILNDAGVIGRDISFYVIITVIIDRAVKEVNGMILHSGYFLRDMLGDIPI